MDSQYLILVRKLIERKNKVMMHFGYLLFFWLLNIFIFSILTKKIQLNNNIKLGFTILILIVVITHFFISLESNLSNSHFLHLLGVSLLLIAVHFLSKLPILMMKKINKKFEDHLAYKGFNFLRNYVVYGLICLYQFISIFSANARNHFNSIDLF